MDAAFIEGWYDGIMLANYVPLYYGNGTAGSEFGTAWCNAVSERPEVALEALVGAQPGAAVGDAIDVGGHAGGELRRTS